MDEMAECRGAQCAAAARRGRLAERVAHNACISRRAASSTPAHAARYRSRASLIRAETCLPSSRLPKRSVAGRSAEAEAAGASEAEAASEAAEARVALRLTR